MCIPLVVAAVVGVSNYMESEAANKAADYNANIADRNAELVFAQAVEARKLGTISENKFRNSVEAFKGTQKAVVASSGAKVGVGSAQDIITDTTNLGEQDAMTIKYNTTKEVEAKRIEAENYKEQAKSYRSSKRNSLLSAAGAMTMSYAGYH